MVLRANAFGLPMIEVPAVTLASHTIGPVWFTARPDPNFHDFMSRMLDRRVESAIGGSALGYLEMTIDCQHVCAAFRQRAAR